jgi:hypothetical protein
MRDLAPGEVFDAAAHLLERFAKPQEGEARHAA